jgi:ESS family glutamate:Na+ symporter
MDFHWLTFVHLGVIALSLLLATWIRSRVRFFQNFLIPNSLTAGFILLVFYACGTLRDEVRENAFCPRD